MVQRRRSSSQVGVKKKKVITQSVPISSQNVSIVANIDQQSADVIHSKNASLPNLVADDTLNNHPNLVSYMNQSLLYVTTRRGFVPLNIKQSLRGNKLKSEVTFHT
jgi:hypothetical protein